MSCWKKAELHEDFQPLALVRGSTDGPGASELRVCNIQFLRQFLDVSRALIQHLRIERFNRHDSVGNANTEHHRDHDLFIGECVGINIDSHLSEDLAPIHLRISQSLIEGEKLVVRRRHADSGVLSLFGIERGLFVLLSREQKTWGETPKKQ